MSERPRVALLANRLVVPSPTGIARYVSELVTALHGAAAADPSGPAYEVASPHDVDRPEWLPAGMRQRQIRGPARALTLSWNLLRRPRIDRSLGGPDLVHALSPWSTIPTKAPLVVTVHDLLPIAHPDWYSRKERFINGRGIRDALARARLVVTDASYIADQLETLGVQRERVRVVPVGVGDEFFTATHLPDATVAEVCARYGVVPGSFFLVVGTVSTRKNHSVLARALAQLPPQGSRPELLAVGPDGPGADEIRAEAATLGVADRIRFGGFAAAGELPALLRGARALLHPSLEEGFGLTPIEAMAAGTPAVTSDRTTLPEVVGDGGRTLPADDVDAWAGVLHDLRADDHLVTSLRSAGRRRAERFRWATIADEVRAVHREALGR